MVIINDAIWYDMLLYKFRICITLHRYFKKFDSSLVPKKCSHRHQLSMADIIMEDSHTYLRYYILFVSKMYIFFSSTITVIVEQDCYTTRQQ